MRVSSNVFYKLLDATLIFALSGAVLYAVGSMVDYENALDIGIPVDFASKRPFTSTAFSGGLFISTILIPVVLSLIVLKWLAERLFPRSYGIANDYLKRKYEQHPFFSIALLIPIVALCVSSAIQVTREYKEVAVPEIGVFRLTDGADLADESDTLEFVRQHDDLFFLKRSSDKAISYVTVNKASVAYFEFSVKDQADAAAESPSE